MKKIMLIAIACISVMACNSNGNGGGKTDSSTVKDTLENNSLYDSTSDAGDRNGDTNSYNRMNDHFKDTTAKK
jgi:hypothetical protein